MRRQMLVINVVLLVAAISLAVKLRGDWRLASLRYRVLASASQPASPAIAAPAMAPAVADLEIIAQRNLFSPDRTNELPKAAVAPPPPEPLLVGTLNLGKQKLALLGEANGNMPRQVKEGETFAGYRLVSIGNNEVVLEYQGQQKKVDLSAVRQVSPPPGTTAGTAALPVTTIPAVSSGASDPPVTSIPAPKTGSTGPSGRLVPGTDAMFGSDDGLPDGAIVGNRRKVIQITPFGKQIWWEPVKPEERKPQ